METVEDHHGKHKACHCSSCKASRHAYYLRNKEKRITANMTPEQREARNRKRMEYYYAQKAAKTASQGSMVEAK